jgi:HSP20 family protein
MSIIKRNSELFPSFPTFFNDFWTRDLFDREQSNYSNTGTTIPAVNIQETGDAFLVEMAAPGMNKKDFKIELDGNLLTISSEMKQEHEDREDSKFNRKEFSYQSFQRTFTLSKDVVDADKIEAKYENGLLRLRIPKREEVKQKPPRMINIS